MDKQHLASSLAGMATGTYAWLMLPDFHTIIPAVITALLTGAAGFLGSYITKQIIKKWKSK